MTITKEIILRDYEKLKRLAAKNIRRKRWETACAFIKTAATLMYNSNLIYADDELESDVKLIAENVLGKAWQVEESQRTGKRVVFYDYFMLDNRGLTEQYLDALFDSEFELLFVGIPDGDKSREIIRKLKEHDVKTVFIARENEVDTARAIYDAVTDFRPDIILAHTSPWDVAGLMAISRLENRCIRYLSNITDHAFWLGARTFDYYLEFRDYGWNISRLYRGIDAAKKLKLPYYPMVNDRIPFEGFDFETSGKKLVFSGGSIYKIQGSDTFLNLAKHILDAHDDAVFLYLGGGDHKIFDDFIARNGFQNRFFYGRERKDIFEVFSRCFFYLSTYPLIGGLMTQYACIAGKLPLTLNDKNDPCDDIYELLIDNKDIDFQFSDIDALKSKIDFYFDNPEKLREDGESVRDSVISCERFAGLLMEYFDTPQNALTVKEYDIDSEKFAEQYIARFTENDGLSYIRLFVCRDLRTLPCFFGYYAKIAIRKLLCRISHGE